LSRRRGFVPLDWEQKLEAFGQTPEYRAMLEEFEPLMVQFEQGVFETGLIELLEETLKGRPVSSGVAGNQTCLLWPDCTA